MKARIGRFAALATALALAVTGTVTVSNAVATQPAVPQEDAALVQDMHDALADAADAGDVAEVKSTLTELEPLLTELASGERYALAESSRELAGEAGEAVTTIRDQVDRLFPEGAREANPPSVAEQLNELVQRLLQRLSQLVNDLLGGGPVPL
ncbi:hypothetical protein [Actinophytocola glycyrrhizae]|uniref:Uncharacterized protein n=1 Tax=Actinophytocola glycyrrhizae TaxID=2044873 RepID=A0ABV9S551_9PSEU